MGEEGETEVVEERGWRERGERCGGEGEYMLPYMILHLRFLNKASLRFFLRFLTFLLLRFLTFLLLRFLTLSYVFTLMLPYDF